jgi:hypothetical protein
MEPHQDALNVLRTWITIRLSKTVGFRRVSTCSGSSALERASKRRSVVTLRNETRGGADRDRTDDLGFAKPALSQLSYSPVEAPTLNAERRRWGSYRRDGGPR